LARNDCRHNYRPLEILKIGEDYRVMEISKRSHTHTHIYIYIYRESEEKREKGKERSMIRERNEKRDK
jgi:hypothetical protein